MGSGKSTLGRAAAAATGRRYVDNDTTIADLAGRSTAELSAVGGGLLHEWEATYLRGLVAEGGPVVAGIPASCADRRGDLELLATSGLTVYLRCSPRVLVDRVLAGPSRPWLSGSPDETAELITRMFTARDETLQAYAEVVLDGEQPADVLLAQLIAFDRQPAASFLLDP